MANKVKIGVTSLPNPVMPGHIKVGEYDKYEKEIKAHIKSYIDMLLPDSPDLIILPECCNRFTPVCYEKRDVFYKDVKKYYRYAENRFVEYMKDVAVNNNTNIAYSAVRFVPETERYLNSTVYITRNGSIAGIYDKNHLVIEENTECNIDYGSKAELIKLDFGKVATAICFDLNFDELMYKYKSEKPDLTVFASAYHGGLRQEQFAYMCRSYFASSVLGLESRIINPYGKTVAATTNYTPCVTAEINLDYELCHIDYNFEKIKQAKAKYKDALTVYDPGYAGSVMLTCESEDISVEEIIKEFDIEKLDDYFKRALAHRNSHLPEVQL